MIIGISGKMRSGKDTVGKIIQYLTQIRKEEPIVNQMTFDEFNSKYDLLYEKYISPSWQIKKFSYKLKQIVSILTGISLEDLEKQEVKDRVLGEEWDRYYLSYYKLQTTMNRKGKISRYFNSEEELDNYLLQLKNNDKNGYMVACSAHIIKEQITIRQLLQEVGTQAMRNVIHPDIWVNALLSEYRPSIEGYPFLTKSDGKDLIENKVYSMGKAVSPNWIITDVRFPNEAKAIKDRNGIVIRVNRIYDNPMINNDLHSVTDYQHESETALNDYNFDYILDNDSTMEHLIEKVKLMLKIFERDAKI